MIEVVRSPYGEVAAALLAEQVNALQAGSPLTPVTVVVPGNYAAVAGRRDLARRGGVAAVSCITLSRLADRLGSAALAASGRRPISAPLLVAAMRAVLAGCPGVFVGVADHRATELALAAAYRELRGVSPAALDALAQQSQRAADVVRIVRDVHARLAPRWYDEADVLAVAIDRASNECTPLILHLPQDLSILGGRLVRAIADHAPVIVNVGASGEDAADAPVIAAMARAGIVVPPAEVDRPRADRIVSVSDPDEEVRAAVRSVVDAARKGVPLGRMAVLFGAANPYARLVREQLQAAGIALNGTPVRVIGDMLAGRHLRSVLALGERDFRRTDVLTVLGVTHPRRARSWERISRAAGVVGGREWVERIETFVGDAERRAAAAEADERPALAYRLLLDVDRAHALADAVANLRGDLAAGAECATWSALAAWASAILARDLGDRGEEWPAPEAEASDRVDAAIERLGDLDAIGGPVPTVDLFRRALDGELDVGLQRIGRLGEGVLVGSVSLAVGLTLDRVVVLGLAEGTFPDRRLDDSLLPDRERAVAGGELALRADHVETDHRHLLAALAAASHATVCFPRGDLRRQGARSASRWLLDDATALARSATPLFTADLDGLGSSAWLDAVPSFAAGLARTAFPTTAQEHRIALLLRGATLDSDEVVTAGFALARARRGAAFTRFDGNLADVDVARVIGAERALSATRLQAWAACPHAFLLEHVLGVEVVEEPERRLRLDPLDRGSLLHRVLHRFVEEGPFDTEWLRTVAAEVFDEFEARGRTGRKLFWRRDRARLLIDLEQFFLADRAWRAASGAEPVTTERRFDTAIPIGVGRVLRVKGAIDRVDRLPDGSLSVVDYKSGKPDGYRSLGPDDRHQRGVRLQPVIYAAGARSELGDAPVRFDYWFVRRASHFRRIGYDIDHAAMEEVGAVLATIASGIEGGVFPLRPPEKPEWNRVDCWFCAPDGLSAAHARRGWERKRRDPGLAAYTALCEAADDDGDD